MVSLSCRGSADFYHRFTVSITKIIEAAMNEGKLLFAGTVRITPVLPAHRVIVSKMMIAGRRAADPTAVLRLPVSRAGLSPWTSGKSEIPL